MIHSMEFVVGNGRVLRFEVRNKSDDKLLGMIVLASDMPALDCRDNWIGWDRKIMMEKGKLRNTAVMSSCVAVQPFGYNMLGLKLIASMVTDKVVRSTWKERYGDELVGVTTTSLYGSYSAYNSIPLWKKMGKSNGRIMIKPNDEIYDYWHQYIKSLYPKKIKEMKMTSGYKQKILSMMYRMNGLTERDAQQNMIRGVYFSPFYKNTQDFLCDEIKSKDLILDDRIERGSDYIMEWWRQKAKNRLSKLIDKNQLSNDVLWYGNFKEYENLFQTWLSVRGMKYYE
tara:strand:- start:23 stop:874 length:852 start_codon:yes stop_codon:yes gene_type:complete